MNINGISEEVYDRILSQTLMLQKLEHATLVTMAEQLVTDPIHRSLLPGLDDLNLTQLILKDSFTDIELAAFWGRIAQKMREKRP